MNTYAVYVNGIMSGYVAAIDLKQAWTEATRLWNGHVLSIIKENDSDSDCICPISPEPYLDNCPVHGK